MKRIFSGVQPSGNLHLGNYLGAIRNFVALQNDFDCIYCVVDQHAITLWQDPETLRQRTREVTAGYLAAGIDPKTSIIFNQSQVAAHSQLAWVFNCVTRIGWLNRMTQFKDKAGKNREKASSGLYVYPNLMAADILVYKATHVPVGEDQKQHLELTRDIALKFNHDYGREYFPIVEPLIQGTATRVMSLRDGSKKMSSSDPSDAARINMTDDADAVAKKIRRATSDSELLPEPEVIGADSQFTAEFRQARPEAANLLTLFAALADRSLEETVGAFAGKGFADFKKELTDLAVARLGPMGEEMKRLVNDPSHVDQVLREGGERARAMAQPIVDEVYDIVGFIRP
jgi:tryptophanyl-tRNA synthetase